MPDPDERIPDVNVVSITPFVGDQMFQRWLVDKIHHRHEMEFERGALSPLVGFLTGMDDQFFSISTTSERIPRSRVVPRSTITLISETGRSLHEFDQQTEGLIKSYTRRLHRACAEQLIPSSRIPRPSRPSGDRVSQQSV